MRIEVKECAELMEVPEQTIRVMLQRGSELGKCEKLSSINTYLIYSNRLADYIGKPVEEVEALIKAMRGRRI